MMQELVAKMTGQEQDWQKMLDKLRVEMDSKVTRAAFHLLRALQTPTCFLRAHLSPPPTSPLLDLRLELDPVKQSLEDRWKSLRQQLKERSPLYQADPGSRHAEVRPGRRKGGASWRVPMCVQRDWRDPIWDRPVRGKAQSLKSSCSSGRFIL